ncbi:MAG: L-lactate dehydrogenase [Firmicutes bacterium]|nr:L-lactate dehydrogenase [Bacillota bacterium]
MNNKVVIIGCGNVGMSYAYALLNQRTYVNKLYLIDLDEQRVEGEVMDLNHCLSYAPSKISINKGSYADCKDARIVVIAAGANQKPGETRMDLINKNAVIFKDIVSKVMASGFEGIFLVATNPVDIMTYLTYKYSGFPAERVIGTGTSLDTARLQLIIGKKLCINPKNIQAYVIGEHGDSEFIPWSHANISLQNIKEFFDFNDLEEIENEVRNAAYEIINKKGATYYGIGMAMVRITNAILGNENTIIALSIYEENSDVYIGMPAIVNEKGVQRRIPLKLNSEEEKKFQASINILKENIDNIL